MPRDEEKEVMKVHFDPAEEATIRGIMSLLKSMAASQNNNAEVLMEIRMDLSRIFDAFPSDEYGGMRGHRNGHERDYVECKERKAIMKYVKLTAIGVATTAFLIWMWQAGVEKAATALREHPVATTKKGP